MKFCLITFRSVTPAQRGEQVLKRAGLECNIQRTPKWMEEQGCGYSLKLRQSQAPEGVALLRLEQIPFKRIYLRHDSGKLEEMHL